MHHLVSQAAVKTFDEGILVGFTRLNVIDEDPIGLAPLNQDCAEEFRIIVDPEHVWYSR